MPVLILMFFSFTACGVTGDESDGEGNLVEPANSDAISEVLIMPQGTQSENGNPPPPSSDSAAPRAENNIAQINSSNGSTAPINFQYNNVDGTLSGVFLQVQGAASFFDIPLTGNTGRAGGLQLPIGIPSNVNEGRFCVDFCVYDTQNRISNIISTCVDVLRLGTGALQISLSWDNSSDQDLYVTDPSGTEIYYANPSSSTGGELDRDDTDGFGPENIFWTESAPDGEYTVEVDDFSGVSSTNFIVTITGPSTTRSFNGRTSNGNRVTVARFTKSGSNLSF